MLQAILSLCSVIFLVNAWAATHPKSVEIIEDKNILTIYSPALKDRASLKMVLDNGLQVYIISDPGTDKSAAGLCVESGSWSDPKAFPGMAHFLEHMLFMGTAAYPEEEGFFRYVMDNGGSPNAYTAPDRTVYMFSINHESFCAGLDQFSHFFIDPLFKTSGVSRELLAVDQEHAKNIENDSWREWMILKEIGNSKHPNALFSTGNAQTLGHIPREALIDWYQEHYNANQMHLVIYSALPLEEIKAQVVKNFSMVPNRQNLTASPFQPLFSQEQKGHAVYIKPIQDLKELHMVWELPASLAKDNSTKSCELIASVLADGGPHSLEQQLKKLELIEGINVEVDRIGHENVLIRFHAQLTKTGVTSTEVVIEHIFSYLNQLKTMGIPKFIFDQKQKMSKVSYNYQTRQDAFHFVSSLAHSLMDEDLATFPMKSTIATEYSPETIKQILNLLTSDQCVYFILASPELSNVAPDRREKWNGGEYAIRKINDDSLSRWNVLSKNSTISVHLESNPYIPEKLELLSHVKSDQKNPTPILLSQDKMGTVYFWEDNSYLTPEISWIISLKSPYLDGSAKQTVLTDLFIRSLTEQLSSELSLAYSAGLSLSVNKQDLSVHISIHGYSEKAPQLLLTAFKNLKISMLKQEQFELYKASLLSQYENADKVLPYVQAAYLMKHTLFNDAPLPSQLAASIQLIQLDDFINFSEKFLQVCYVEALLSGNMHENDAKEAWQTIKTTLHSRPYLKQEQIGKQVLILPESSGPFRLQQQSNMQGNAAFLIIEEGSSTLDKKASQVVLGKALSQNFFATLRTKQQTAYIAKSWTQDIEHQMLHFFVVQSSTHQPEELLARFELFLEEYIKDFESAFPEERFLTIKEMAITSLKMPPQNLVNMSEHLFNLAFKHDGNFDYVEELIQSLEALSYETLKQDTAQFLSRKNGKRLAILVEGSVLQNQKFKYEDVTCDHLHKQGTFISWK